MGWKPEILQSHNFLFKCLLIIFLMLLILLLLLIFQTILVLYLFWLFKHSFHFWLWVHIGRFVSVWCSGHFDVLKPGIKKGRFKFTDNWVKSFSFHFDGFHLCIRIDNTRFGSLFVGMISFFKVWNKWRVSFLQHLNYVTWRAHVCLDWTTVWIGCGFVQLHCIKLRTIMTVYACYFLLSFLHKLIILV